MEVALDLGMEEAMDEVLVALPRMVVRLDEGTSSSAVLAGRRGNRIRGRPISQIAVRAGWLGGEMWDA